MVWNSQGQKTLVSMMAVILSMASLAACSGQDGSGAKGEESANSDSGIINQTGLPIVKQPVTIKMMVKKNVSDKTPWADKEAIKQAEKETGIKFDITEVQPTAWDEKVTVTLASGDLPDVIVGGIKNLSLYTDSFQPLNDLIDKYSPTLKKLYQQHPEFQVAGTLPDGKIYSLPFLSISGKQIGVTYSINKTWLDKLNLKVPTTLDEYYQVLKAFKEKDPNGNGKQDEIPFSFYTDTSYGLDPLLFSFGLFNDSGTNVMVEKGKIVFVPGDPRYYEYLKYLHKLYAEGLMDPDGFVQKNADLVAKGKKGLLGAFNNGSYDDIIVGIENSKNYIDILPMKDQNGGITTQAQKIAGDFSYDRLVISKNSKYADVIVRLFEHMNSSFDKRLLFNYGPENISWKKSDSGDGKIERMVTLPQGYNSYAEVRQSFSPGVNGFAIFMDEDNDKFVMVDPREIKRAKTQDMYLPYIKKETLPLSQNTAEATKEINTMATEINTYLQNFLAQSVLKGIDDTGWKAHLDKLQKLNVPQYVKLYQTFYDKAQTLVKK